MNQLVDVVVKFYDAEGDPDIIAAVVEAVAAVLSIDNVRLTRDGDDDVLLDQRRQSWPGKIPLVRVPELPFAHAAPKAYEAGLDFAPQLLFFSSSQTAPGRCPAGGEQVLRSHTASQ